MSILAAFVIALIISLLLAPGYRTGSYMGLVLFFILLFLAGIAGQFWIVPFGPVWYGVSWGPLLFIVLIVSFLFAAPSPYVKKTSQDQAATSAAAATISIFVWLILTLLLIAILIAIFKDPVSEVPKYFN